MNHFSAIHRNDITDCYDFIFDFFIERWFIDTDIEKINIFKAKDISSKLEHITESNFLQIYDTVKCSYELNVNNFPMSDDFEN